MSKVTLFEAGTVGVDLRTNPLFLGKKKLHAATNLVFEEGVLKTRPGFHYLPLGCSGIFQGACEFYPQRGLSTASFSELEGGVAVAVGGKLYFKCNMVKGVEFPCHGNVNLFQAENYLILQHEESETYWWDGVNSPVKSPGMNEQDWNNPEMPFVEIEIERPVENKYPCEVTTEPSCSVNCDGIINPSDGFPLNIFVNGIFAAHTSRCSWGFYGGGYVHFSTQLPNQCVWVAETSSLIGYRISTFESGPLGQYRTNPDGSGPVTITVT
jgi:hypothetical protein